MENTYLIMLRYTNYDVCDDYCTTYDLPVTAVTGDAKAESLLQEYQDSLPYELEDIFEYYTKLIPIV